MPKCSALPQILALLGGIAFAACQWLVFAYAPEEATLGLAQKIFYIHLPMSWWALVSFFVVFGSSVAYLWRRNPAADRLAAAAAEELRQGWEAMGRPMLVVGCPSCSTTLRTLLPDLGARRCNGP